MTPSQEMIVRWARPVAIATAIVVVIGLALERVPGNALRTMIAVLAGAAVGGLAVWRLWPALGAAPIAVATPPSPIPAEPRKTFPDLAPLLDALPEAALLIDGEGRIVGSNPEARRQLKFEARGPRLSSILRHPEILDAAQAAARDGASRVVEYETPSPQEEHFRVYVAPIAWGEENAALLIFHNQTAQIMTERMRADFLANASHELKTPVTSLSLLIETVSGSAREDAGARERFLGMMDVQVDRMKRLIDDLLSLSKIELNEHVPPSDRADLRAVVGEAIDAVAPIARNRGVTISVTADGPSQVVIGDRFQLVQVAQNLIDNAVKYSPDGGQVVVEIGAAEGRESVAERAGKRWPEAARIALLTPPPSAARNYAFLRVADAGPGVPRWQLPRLSERFFRVERDQTTEKTGTGLGLAIVKHIVNRHRGGFLVESEPGRGSAFAVYLEGARPDAP